VRIEDPEASHVDDVTVFYNDGTPPHFYQVKYHVDQRELYTLELLLEKGKGKSLLEKFYKTYKDHLIQNPGIAAKLHLVSNWCIDPKDKILSTVENEHSRLGDSIRFAAPASDIGKSLQLMKNHLKIDDDELHNFLFTLCFYTGRDCTQEFIKRVQEKMESVGLKSSENDLALAVQIVRDWVKKKHVEVDLKILDEVINAKDLFAPLSGPRSATVYLVTVKKHQFELEPDYIIDFRKYYGVQGAIKGHDLLSEFDYNKTLLPKIQSVQNKLNDETQATLVRARGLSRLSPWFAFGYTFSQVSGYSIEVNQNDRLWSTNEMPNTNFKLVSENATEEKFDSNTGTVAVGISVTGSIEDDVKEYILKSRDVDALLFLRPEKELGANCFQSAGDVVAFAQQFKSSTREFVRERKATKLLLFYFGPFSGACFIGHQLNAVCKEVQIMEKLTGEGYTESFLLA
jgi:hypothetical protein